MGTTLIRLTLVGSTLFSLAGGIPPELVSIFGQFGSETSFTFTKKPSSWSPISRPQLRSNLS